MKKHICILVIVLMSSTTCFSQQAATTEPTDHLNNKIGFAASFFSGYGLSYEYNLNRDYTIEFTASIYGSGGSNNSEYDYNPKYLTSTIGTEFQRNMYVGRDSRFYGFLGLSYWIDNTYDNYNNSTETFILKKDYVAGLGLGWEYILGKRIVFNVEGGYMYRSMNESGTRLSPKVPPIQTYESYTTNSYHLGFGAGVGIYYAF